MAKKEHKEELLAEEAVKAEAPKIAEPKMVKVIPKITGKRYIGGTWYDFVQGKEIEVTQDAKRVLEEADAIRL